MAGSLLRPSALLLLLLCGAAADELLAERASVLPVGSVWAGNYTCGHVPAWLLLHVEAPFPLTAVFHFAYPNSGTHGAFTLKEVSAEEAPEGAARGSDGAPSPRRFELYGEEWVVRAHNTEMVGLSGAVLTDAKGSRLAGSVLHEQCQRFELVRTTIDLAPPADGRGAWQQLPGGAGGASEWTAASARALMLHTFDAVEAQLKRKERQPRGGGRVRRAPRGARRGEEEEEDEEAYEAGEDGGGLGAESADAGREEDEDEEEEE